MTKHAQKLRLLYLKDIFEHDSDAEHFLTCKQLIEKLELRGVIVERKTLYDDIACLKEYGMDIEKGSNKQGWRLVSRNFEDADLHFMADVVQSSKFLTKAKSLKLIEKISNLSSSFFGSNLKKQLYVENRIRNKNSASFYNLDAVQRALSGNAKLEFSYYRYDVHKKFIPRKNGEKYLVVPLHLVYSDAFYYLVAWSEKDSEIRNYRIDRMRDVVPCDAAEKNSEIEDFNITKYMQTTFSMYPGEKANLTLKVSNSAMSAFIDRFGEDVCVTKVVEEACSIAKCGGVQKAAGGESLAADSAQNAAGSDDCAVAGGEGGVAAESYAIANVSVMVSPTFYGWLSQFPSEITILKPANHRKKYAAYLRAILWDYK